MIKPLDVLYHLLHPLSWIACSTYYFPITFFKLLFSLHLSVLLSPSAFKDAWFANMWKVYGPRVKENALPGAQPLISLASGVVLGENPPSL